MKQLCLQVFQYEICVYLFIYFWCVRSPLWHTGFSPAVPRGLRSEGLRSLQHAGSPTEAPRLSSCAPGFSCPTACSMLVLRPGVKPISPALESRFLTTGPPGKSLNRKYWWSKIFFPQCQGGCYLPWVHHISWCWAYFLLIDICLVIHIDRKLIRHSEQAQRHTNQKTFYTLHIFIKFIPNCCTSIVYVLLAIDFQQALIYVVGSYTLLELH